MSLNSYYYNTYGKQLDDILPLNHYIRLMLENHKLRQKDMAAHLGMKAPQISRLCTKKKTSYKTLRRLAEYFDKDYETIVKMAIKAGMI